MIEIVKRESCANISDYSVRKFLNLLGKVCKLLQVCIRGSRVPTPSLIYMFANVLIK